MEKTLYTRLFETHKRSGAKFINFAGYSMPVHYDLGVLKEHLHTRKMVGLFDVSHMGQIKITSKQGLNLETQRILEKIMPCDLHQTAENTQQYSFLLNSDGGVIDDLMIAKKANYYLLVVNAARKHVDVAHLETEIGQHCNVELLDDRSLLALQGPLSEKILKSLVPNVARMQFLNVLDFIFQNEECWISRSGYTGEDGFEISLPDSIVENFVSKLLQNPEVELIGLGARDSLRMEAGLCLYGNELSRSITPVEAGLTWAIKKNRLSDKFNDESFVGAKKILEQLKNGVNFKRVGLLPVGRAPIRQEVELFAEKHSKEVIGKVTSGGFSPTLSKPISIARLENRYCEINKQVFAEVRGVRLPVTVCKLPFIQLNYRRKRKNDEIYSRT